MNIRARMSALLLVCVLTLSLAAPVPGLLPVPGDQGLVEAARTIAPPLAPPSTPPDPEELEAERLEEIESRYVPTYAHLATGDPAAVPDWKADEIAKATGVRPAAHATYAWPFTLNSMGHAIQSYQNYSSGTSSAYFHHGLDMMAVNGTQVYNRSGGQVVNVENYQPGNDMYWEVAVKDPEGYIWQYHHVDKNTIPQAIKNAYAAYQADPINGGFISANTHIGNIVYWSVVSFGQRFNHIHLNILAAGGVYVNGFEFHTALADATNPQIQGIGFLVNNTVTAGNAICGNHGLYVRARDLTQSAVYYLPPYKVLMSVDSGPQITVWEFANLPGGASDKLFVNDYYVAPPTCGNYSCRDFYIDLGFTTSGQRAFPITKGWHIVDVTVYDYAGNSASSYWTWQQTCGPTSVTLKSFTATVARRAVNLAWETSSEIDNLGFNLYRSLTVSGRKTKINTQLIPSKVAPGSPFGAKYSYQDTVTAKIAMYYWLEEVDIYGKTKLHGPVQARPQ